MDLYHYFGNDISVASNGDLLLVDGLTLSKQRILRRLLTNPGDYIFDLNYGAGLAQFVGQPLTTLLKSQITGLITSNMFLETSVSQTPPPVITLQANQTQLFCQIQYTELSTNTLQVLDFGVSV